MQKTRSRFSRNLEKQSKKQLTYSIIGIVVIILVLLKFSGLLIEGIGNLTLSIKGDKHNVKQQVYESLQTPNLSSIPDAVSTSSLKVSGNVNEDMGTVEIFLNNKRAKKITLDDNTFSTTITLKEGENRVKARHIIDERESEFTRELVVMYLKEPPKLEVGFPSHDAQFTKGDQEIEVQGKTEAQNTVTVNGFRAIVNENGNFSYYLRLNDGDNTITIEAENPTGQKTKEERKVRYNP